MAKKTKRPTFAVIIDTENNTPFSVWQVEVFGSKSEAADRATKLADTQRREVFVAKVIEAYQPRDGADVVKL